MVKFNAQMPDHKDVQYVDPLVLLTRRASHVCRYFSYAGSGEHTLPIHPLYITHKLVFEGGGAPPLRSLSFSFS